MGRITQLVLIFTLTIGLASCQSFGVRSDWDPTKSFDSFHRYFWIEPPEVEGANPFADNTLMRKRVRHAIEVELEERGFVPAPSRDAADFAVTYSVILEERLRVDGYSASTGGAGYRHRRFGFGAVHSTTNVRNFQESTLIVDFLDPGNDDLVWRGWGTGIVRTRDRDRGRDRLEKGVRAVLERFPPGEQGSDG